MHQLYRVRNGITSGRHTADFCVKCQKWFRPSLILQETCPQCKQPPDKLCVTPSGHPTEVQHRARRHLVNHKAEGECPGYPDE